MTMESGKENPPPLLLELPAARNSVGLARHALSRLSESLPASILEDLKLLLSELITNSIRHTGLGSGDVIEVKVTRSPGIVRAEVTDHGPGFTQEPPKPLSERESGWGLFLVEQISDRWGLSVNQETRVWFELDVKDDGLRGLP